MYTFAAVCNLCLEPNGIRHVRVDGEFDAQCNALLAALVSCDQCQVATDQGRLVPPVCAQMTLGRETTL